MERILKIDPSNFRKEQREHLEELGYIYYAGPTNGYVWDTYLLNTTTQENITILNEYLYNLNL